MGTFTLNNGRTFDIKGHNGPKARVLIQRKYNSSDKQEDIILQPHEVTLEKIFTSTDVIIDDKTFNTYEVEDTFVEAYNYGYEEYKTVDILDGNIEHPKTGHYKAEVVFQLHFWRKRVLFNWHGTTPMINFLSEIESHIHELIEKDPNNKEGISYSDEYESVFVFTMHDLNGAYQEVPIHSKHLTRHISSARVVDFSITAPDVRTQV